MSVGRVTRPTPALADLRRMFRHQRVVHVASTAPDGTPHVVPLWFVWLEEAVVVTTREGSRLVRNVALRPRVALSIESGRSWTEHVGVMVRGRAEILEPHDQAARRALSAWFEKYRDELSGKGFAAYAEQVERPLLIRVRPEGLATWMHGAPAWP